MTIDPTRIDKEELYWLRRDIAETHGINLFVRYTERAAAGLLSQPDERREGRVNVSTLKRKRRTGKIPHVPLGDGSVAYLGMMLADFIAFGERSVLLWGGGEAEGGGEGGDVPPAPAGGPAPQPRDGGGRDAMETEAAGGSDGPVHEA